MVDKSLKSSFKFILYIAILIFSTSCSTAGLPKVDQPLSSIKKDVININNYSYVVPIPGGFVEARGSELDYLKDLIDPVNPWERKDLLKGYINKSSSLDSKLRFVVYGTKEKLNQKIPQSEMFNLGKQMSQMIEKMVKDFEKLSKQPGFKKALEQSTKHLDFKVINMGGFELLANDGNVFLSTSKIGLKFDSGETFNHYWSGGLVLIDGNIFAIAAIDISKSPYMPEWNKNLVKDIAAKFLKLN